MKAHTVCPRCLGNGYLGQYSHVQDGICFRCKGSGEIQVQINFWERSIQVGAQTIPIEPYQRMNRKELVQEAAQILNGPPSQCNQARSIAILGLVLGLADLKVRDRGLAAFDTRCEVPEDRNTLRALVAKVSSLRKQKAA